SATLLVGILILANMPLARAADKSGGYPATEQVLSSQTDILGELSLKQPGGPSYEFFVGAMPPLRYVDANFRHYPIVLSAPASVTKGRLVGNGSSINALTRSRSWINETGRPVTFYVGDKRDIFGSNLAHLDGPKYAEGYLPIVKLAYSSGGAS